MQRRHLRPLMVAVLGLVMLAWMAGQSADEAIAQGTESVTLPIGCSNQALTWSVGTPLATVARAVSPPGNLISIFKLDPATRRFRGFSPTAPSFANDYTMVETRLEAVFFCMRSAGSLARPVTGVAAPPPAAPPPPPPPPLANCHPSYPTVCIPPPPPDLDCADIPHRRFTVLPPDPHRFDADRDGIGCET